MKHLLVPCCLLVLLLAHATPVKAADSGEYVFSDEEIDERLKLVQGTGTMEGVWSSEELGGEFAIVLYPLIGKSANPPYLYGFPVEEVSGSRTYGQPVMFIYGTHAGTLYRVTIERGGTTSLVGTTVFSGDNTIDIGLSAGEPGKMETIRLIRVMSTEDNKRK